MYFVKTEELGVVKCFPRGKLKDNGGLFIGDYVDIVVDKEGIIEALHPRKSQLVRPYVSNIDGIIIILAPIPKPDMLLADKLIIGAIEQGITPIVCVNKADMVGSDKVIDEVTADYQGLAKIIAISTQTGQGIDELLAEISGKYFCLAGQSAVGKSSLINTIWGEVKMKVGELSARADRGQNTTRHVEILELADGTKIADTCGFNMLEMPLFDPTKLASYYVDFDDFAKKCKYKGCCHNQELNCGVKQAVLDGEISQERYDRYIKLFKDIKTKWEKRY